MRDPIDPRSVLQDLTAATILLTRLPLPATDPIDAAGLARSVRAFPLVGIIVGIVGAVAYLASLWIGLTPFLAATVAVASQIVVTGAMHEDGLGDVADGLGGGRDRERILAIMRDSRTGTFGVLAVLLCVLMRVGAIAAIEEPGAAASALVAVGALSRAAAAVTQWAAPPARRDGLSAAMGRPTDERVLVAGAIAALAAFVLLPFATAIVATALAGATAIGVAADARRRIGGQTGDVLGASQQLAEMVALVAIAAGMAG